MPWSSQLLWTHINYIKKINDSLQYQYPQILNRNRRVHPKKFWLYLYPLLSLSDIFRCNIYVYTPYIQQEQDLQLIEKFIDLIDKKILHHTISEIIEPNKNTFDANDDETEQKESDIASIELKSLNIDSNLLQIDDLRRDLSNALELSLKDATCMKLLLWINTFLQINSKNQSILNTDDNMTDDLVLDKIPLHRNLLSFLEELMPFQKLYAPSDKYIAGIIY